MSAPQRLDDAMEAPRKGVQTEDREARLHKAKKGPTVRHGHKGPSWCQRIPWVKGRTARQMPRPIGNSKLDSKLKNPRLPRARMVQLPQPTGRLRTRCLKRMLLREPGKSRKPRLLLPLRTVGPRQYLYLEDRSPQGPTKTWHAYQGLVTQRGQ